jgi:hypothetical protein
VIGRITHDGKPVARGFISYIPLEGRGLRGATSKTDQDGRYTLGTYTAKDGATPGSYLVTVMCYGPDPDNPPEPNINVENELNSILWDGIPLIPEKYFSAEYSPLRAEVIRGIENVIDFDLEVDPG